MQTKKALPQLKLALNIDGQVIKCVFIACGKHKAKLFTVNAPKHSKGENKGA